jgi:acyl-CoA synthetase (AMP-forming)/AMP-acid ligase II
LLTNTSNIAERLGVDRPSRFLGVLPLHHTNGQVFNTLLPALTGATVFCHMDFGLPFFSSFWADVKNFRIEYVDMVPTVIRTLLALPPQNPPDVSSLKYVVCGGAPVPAEVLDEFQDRFGVAVLQEYGLTEATCVSAMEGPSARRRGTVGRPLPGTLVEIRDQDGRICEPNRRGEIFLRSDCAMIGYLGGADEKDAVRRDGWLATGDIGTLDDDGFLTITGRLKHVIIKGGENIHPEDVERVAHRCEFVRDAMALGIPDEFFGETVGLMIVWRNGIAQEIELKRVLDDELPIHWRPSCITSVESVPRNPSGKILRHTHQSVEVETK